MQRKIISTMLLIIGLISVQGIMISCKKNIERCGYAGFRYNNESSKDLMVIEYYWAARTDTITLTSGETLTGTVELWSGHVEEGYAFPYRSDSLIIISDTFEKKWLPCDTSSRNPLLLRNYESLTESDKKDEVWVFTFAENDFDVAKPIRQCNGEQI